MYIKDDSVETKTRSTKEWKCESIHSSASSTALKKEFLVTLLEQFKKKVFCGDNNSQEWQGRTFHHCTVCVRQAGSLNQTNGCCYNGVSQLEEGEYWAAGQECQADIRSRRS